MTKAERKKRFDALRELTCCRCQATPVQVAHSNFAKHGKGRGIKADDRYTIPLCHKCHQEFDQYSMGMDRAQSEAWFEDRLAFVNEALNAL